VSSRRATDKRLDALRAVAGCEQRSSDAAHPVMLCGAVRNLAVLEGAVDLFAIRREDGRQSGPRLALGRLGPGEMVLALDSPDGGPQPDGGTLALLAVGISGTRIVENLPVERLAPAHQAAIADRLAALFAGALADTDVAADRRSLSEQGEFELVDGAIYAAQGRRPLWLLPEPGTRLLPGGVDFTPQDGPESVPVPLTSRLWARAVGHGAAHALPSEALDDPGRALTALPLHVAGIVRERLLREARRGRGRLERQRSGTSEALTRSLHDLAAVIDPAHEAAAASGRDSLFTAFALVGRELGLTIMSPAGREGGQAHMTDLEALATASGVRTRDVLLRGDWWQQDAGPLLAWLDAATPVALLREREGYVAVVPGGEGHARLRVDATLATRLSQHACMLYRPLPDTVSGPFTLLRTIADLVLTDLRRYVYIGFAAGLFAAATPLFTGILLENVIPRASLTQFAQVLAGLLAVGLGAVLFELVRAATLLRVTGRADLHLQAAVVDRLLRLPVRFFRDFTSGDLAERAMGIHTIRSMLTNGAISALLGALFSVSSLVLMCYYSVPLAALAVALVLLQTTIGLLLTLWQLREERAEIEFEGRVEGFTAQLLTAIGKLRVAAADVRGYARWSSLFAEQRRRFVATQRIVNIRRVIFAFFPTLTLVAIYVGAVKLMGRDGTTLGLGAFIAFTAAYGQFQAALSALVGALMDSIAIVPRWERLKPILETAPERRGGQRIIALRGDIELSGVTYRYGAGTEPAVADLSLRIRAGEFVALVGGSGAGKSTVLRLMLGFERPERGTVLFDGIPMDELDPGALRRQIGVVLQHGQLTSGTVLSNIVGTSTLTPADAARAAAQVGLDADLETMPMGLHTLVTEGVNTLSGGQRQRLLLARALAHEPAALYLDEATSALDNRTQEIVTRTLKQLDCTRIVVAHRLSTIAEADRIVVLDAGRVVQQGSYAALMAEAGPFRNLAERQLI
jgi:NHLM bacteriocin system ABC transporter ATP-binding protein